ncbi:MAG: NDP-sugar synthase [Gammaproteobacteria bacterium]|nr:NDP-sugar synthase [Gammaproteobacteria bacterium]
MKAMILAAGKGTRMRPLSYALPKPMIPLLGKPVMEYLVEQLVAHGFNRIMVNVSYLPQIIERYFGDGRRWGAEIGYSFEGTIRKGEMVSEPAGSAGGLKKVHDHSGFFDDTFLVVCGDTMLEDLDLTAAVRKHWQSGCIASLAVCEVPRERVSDYGVVVCGDGGRVSSFQEKPAAGEARSNLANTGVYIFEPQVLDLIPPAEFFDIGTDLFPLILQKNLPLNAIRMPFTWMDIGHLQDYWATSQKLMRGGAMPGVETYPKVWTGLNASVDWRSANITGPVYIGAGARVEAHCTITGPAWIGHGCHLQSGANLHRCILLEYTRIKPGVSLRDAVVFQKNCVDKNGKPLSGAEARGIEDAREAAD